MGLADVLVAVTDVLFPDHCLVTGQPLTTTTTSPLPHVSQEALDALLLAPRPVELLLTLQRHHAADELFMSTVRALYAVGGTGDCSSIIYAIKYGGRTALARSCGQWMAPLIAELPRTPTMLVPVPIHPARRRERGYNQAEELAHGIAAVSGIPVVAAIRRTVHTSSQTTLADEQRQQNVRSVFALTELPDPSILQGAVCALIDDVCTTGATLNACAEVLLQGGAARVDALTFGATV